MAHVLHPAVTSPAPAASAGLEDAYGNAMPRRRRLLLSGVITGLALVGVAGALARQQYDDARQSAVDNARARVVLASAMIDSYFGGELSTLSAIAQSPPVLSGDVDAMHAYFRRVQPPGGAEFGGGLGWADRNGSFVASSGAAPERMLNVSDRSYFKAVMTTGSPFVSEGIASRRTHRRVIVMAVPTRDAAGRLTGVLAGALYTDGFQINSGSLDLGFDGLAVLDRNGRAVLDGFTRPRNGALQRELRSQQVGLFSNVRGLDGKAGHLVAFATAQVPAWTIAIDRPRADVFAAAWRGLMLDLALLGAAAAIAFGLMGRQLLRARREAEDRSARARQRGELSHAFSAASLAGEVASGLASGLEAAFPGAVAIVALEAEDRLGLRLAAIGTASPWPVSDAAADLVVAQIATRVHESGFPLAIEAETRFLGDLPQLHGALGGACRSLYAAPLRMRGARPAGALCLLFPDERTLDEAELAHLAWSAGETAQALARTRSYEHEHAVATSLQRSLLSQELPQIEGVELLGHYEAGSAGLEIGGDWYDVIRTADGSLLISVGDVAGHGLTAAVLMGQMRNAFRAYAFDHRSPAEVLRRMRRHVTGEAMATALCMRFDPYTRELAYASAGHPPSLLVAGDGSGVSRLDQACAPPLGYVEADAIQEATTMLAAGGTVVAYTDGLVERRDWSLDDGIDLLADVLASSTAEPAEEVAARMVHEVARRVGSGDDMAFLIVRANDVPGRLEVELSGDPLELAGLRRRLRTWLELRGLSEDEREDAVLSISEACNNAIEHGYGGQPGTIGLTIDHTGAALQITVEDHGSWRPPVPHPERGLGIWIMQSVMQEASLEHQPGRTRVVLSRQLAP
jgi:serine phosphatase RsbU (regulator of sigma subunit)/anti-sigma regulatory factor (Ser/Thr protein kinase)